MIVNDLVDVNFGKRTSQDLFKARVFWGEEKCKDLSQRFTNETDFLNGFQIRKRRVGSNNKRKRRFRTMCKNIFYTIFFLY